MRSSKIGKNKKMGKWKKMALFDLDLWSKFQVEYSTESIRSKWHNVQKSLIECQIQFTEGIQVLCICQFICIIGSNPSQNVETGIGIAVDWASNSVSFAFKWNDKWTERESNRILMHFIECVLAPSNRSVHLPI